ncbi:peptidase C39 family protein [Agathobacter rectalis]|uniref:Peptidase C39 family protein n=2 Tax=Agathobacter rectalis TaxID=39491 RepID=A0A413DMT7_9FIRM|nr:peptidase C39 family protein [Agathobacter rectalis]
MTQNKCCRHGANLRRKRRRRRKIRHSVIFLCSSIAVIVFVAVESRMIRSGDGRTNKYDVEAGNNTYDNAVIENSKISEKNKIQNNQSMLDDIMNSTQYPKQLKDLALKNEEALEFVYDYPAEHVKEHTIDLTEEASMDSVPLFVQWDKRWGYEKYSGNFFAASGCGPTTLSMVVVYLTHNREASPIAVAKYSKEAGYSVDGSGSSWTLISEGCRHYGVKAKTVALDESRMKAELDEGHPIVVNVGPGDFTDTGHFMVITGYDDEGFSINDPNSIEKSGKRWLFKNISSQIRAVWSMYV